MGAGYSTLVGGCEGRQLDWINGVIVSSQSINETTSQQNHIITPRDKKQTEQHPHATTSSKHIHDACATSKEIPHNHTKRQEAN